MTKRELLDAVWPGLAVTEDMVAKCVRELRRALGETGRIGDHLEVVHGRGFRLKGVIVGDASAAAEAAHALPSLSRSRLRQSQVAGRQLVPFVGRTSELALIEHALIAAESGKASLLAVTGDPGVGKTRLIANTVDQAGEHGFIAVVGRCMEGEGSPPFWPWVQVLRDCFRDQLRDIASVPLATVGGDLADLLPELARGGVVVPVRPADPDQARFRVFDAVVAFIGQIAAHRPLLIVIDDLHCADAASLALLQAILRELQGNPLLVIASLRSNEIDCNPKIQDLLSSLQREGFCARAPLSGLDRSATASLLTAIAGAPVAAELADSIHTQTGGNPYFCIELWSHLVDEDVIRKVDNLWCGRSETSRVPQGISETITRRLQRLSPSCLTLLSAAAVCGIDFEFDLAVEAAQLQRDAAMDSLDEALRANVITDPDERPGMYRFVHGLAVETIAAQLSAVRRAHLHWQIAEAIERRGSDGAAAALAHHAMRGASQGNWRRAVVHARRAAEEAVAACAYESATALLERAVATVEQLAQPHDGDAEGLRLDLSLLAAESHDHAGNGSLARSRFRSASDIARSLGDSAALGRAALGLATRWTFADGEVVRLLEEARAVVGDASSPLAARLTARLAQALYFFPDTRERRERLCATALERARALGDSSVLASVLNDSLEALFHSDNRTEQQSLATSLYAAARVSGDQRLLLQAHAWRIVVSFCLGRLRDAEGEVHTVLDLAHQVHQPEFLSVGRSFLAALAIARGQFEAAEQHAALAARLGERVDGEAAALVRFAQIFTIRREQARWFESSDDADLRPAPAFGAAGEAFNRAARWNVPFALAELGKIGAARSAFDALITDLDQLPPENARNTRLSALAALGHAAAYFDDQATAERLLPLVRPYADQWMVIGFGTVVLSSMHAPLATLTALSGDYSQACVHFDLALAEHEREGAVVAQARTYAGYAAALLRSGRRADERRAGECLEQGLALADRYGLISSAKRLESLAQQLPLSPLARGSIRQPSC